jgi:microcin C transport system substrate-binding protein
MTSPWRGGIDTRRDALISRPLAARPATGFASACRRRDRTHGISSFGDLKYPADFKQLDYVDVNAPKGGVFSQIGPSRQFNQNFLTFNSLNSYILKGDAAQGCSSPSRR